MNNTVSVSSSAGTSDGTTSGSLTSSSRPARALASMLVDQPAGGGRQEPAIGVVGDAVPRPVVGGGDQRLLDGVLGGVEVARAAGERAKDLRRQIAQQVLEARPPDQWVLAPTAVRR
jgi:hypothetical protein